MLSIKRIREAPDDVKRAAKLKGEKCDIDGILTLDSERRKLISSVERLKEQRNKASESISRLKKEGSDASEPISEMREVSAEIKRFDGKIREIDDNLQKLMLEVPNEPHESVPEGEDESANVEVSQWGSKPIYDFKPLNHLELGQNLGILDFQAGSKISGAGFPLYIGMGARLERALLNFMLDVQTDEHGYTEIFPPFLVNSKSLVTTGQLPKFAEDMYHIGEDELYLIPTAEVPVTNIHAGDIIPEERLPITYAAYSACFRREAGSYGKETRGFLRVHQFNKVELVHFTRPEDSYETLEKIVDHATEILRRLGIHYRVVTLATGDLSFAASKCYDIEVWAPGEEKYLEASSCSNFEAFQARRGDIRLRRADTGKVEFVHTLNGSGLATSRLMVALLETCQTEEGSIHLPEPLVPYFGKAVIKQMEVN